MAQKLMTPGVYIEEVNAFPGSVVEVATAIPAFIGYTEKASRNGKSLVNKPTRITSFAEYLLLFGGAFSPKFTLDPVAEGAKPKNSISINDKELAIEYKADNQLFLFNSIKLFYANGGGTCYIVSVGTYKGKSEQKISQDELLGTSKDENDKLIEGGLASLLKEQEPTMIVIPDAVALGDNCYEVYKQVLAQCAKMQNRIAIMDLYDGYNSRDDGDNVTQFREKIGTEYLSYAAAYYPWLHTSIVQKDEITFKNLDEKVDLSAILPEKPAKELVTKFKELAPPEITDDTSDEEKEAIQKTVKNNERNLHLGLVATSPTYVNLLDEIRAVINLLPVSAAMAGVYTTVDNNRGVWKSPANISLNSVIKPAVNITHDQQEDLNVNAVSGKSINAIRTFPGVGTLVWGARTLDGNSLDWKYINVRRTMIMLEQSIKLALRSYVFEPNDANTWVTVKSMIINFLTEKWKQGALAGASPDDAFDVQVGLGTTMTSLDILEGKMLITVKLAIVRPAEFIVVTFEQQMQKS
jgi:phage tail sheath protein FI